MYAARTLVTTVGCPCRRWEFRRVLAATGRGFVATDAWCPKCNATYAIIVQVADTAAVVACVRLRQLNADTLRTALSCVLMSAEEREQLISAALHLADHPNAPDAA